MVAFDLDDTLIKSDHILEAFILQSYASEAGLHTELASFRGLNLSQISFRLSVIKGEHFAHRFVRDFQIWYDDVGFREHTVIDGVYEILDLCGTADHPILIATNKRDEMARIVCEHFFKSFVFDIEGFSLKQPRTKTQMLVCLKRKVPALRVYVGDSKGDLDAATELGLDFLGAAWYVGERSSLPSEVDPCYSTSCMIERLKKLRLDYS